MPNHLAQAQSLYLRKHANNPIDWWYWCDEALEAARRDNKPIFLSIGYSSCHWCTVMEGEAFSDPIIADYLNTYFLPIKVDREERPDLDSIYMQALQMMTGQGGWPLNIFLTPDELIPFYGGTYFPVEPKYGRAGFLQVLQSLRKFYDQDKEKLGEITEEILGGLQKMALLNPDRTLDLAVLRKGLAYSTSIISGKNPGPSFPMIPYADAALRNTRLSLETSENTAEIAVQRGLDLALGGIFDHVAGGFHRYTVDPTWTVPHFEKMLYDNGQIMEYLANLWSLGTQSPSFARSIDRTVQWLQREMAAPAGYFYAAQDADSFLTPEDAEPEEGAFYVWRFDDLQAHLSASELQELTTQFTVTPGGNFEGANVLQRSHAEALSPTVETALEKLFVLRYGAIPSQVETFPPAPDNQTAKTHPWPGRIPAVTDTKMIVAWNSLMISGLARAAAVWGNGGYLELAAQCAQFIWMQQRQNSRLYRLNYSGQVSVPAQSEDYAFLIKALLDLHQATLAIAPDQADSWLTAAIDVQTEFDLYLWSEESGGYFNTAKDASQDLLLRERSYLDNATPSANGIAIANLVRLSLLTEHLTYRDQAEKALMAFSSILQRSPQSCPSLFAALDWFHHGTLIRTTPDGITQLAQDYLPTTVLQLTDELPTGTVALLCQGLACQEPARSWDHLWEQIRAIYSVDSIPGDP
ncbi:thioredoxin domain-containing protein [Alkalinema sp. FACHB-956]|uniref:thioredoxin domain-containing protein n=1 Tax=Alkalinema sp. FACHB-956 TaxID=2692768 RepID=UPI001684659D|nr:thioredoxin domain-containing protein [Alkalinema sp. FACHB-956]MBD2326436.1 thioredoxin domain-containing protein [Alkalinema sp. FACHB-956]